jgi:glutaryl-CoA dehydrogenase
MKAYKAVDYFDMNSLLSDEERIARDTVRLFVTNEVMPIIDECYEKAEFPMHLIPKLGELGVLGANFPEKYGCAGLNNVAYGLISQELERGDSGLRSFATVQSSLVMYPIFAYGSEEQKDYWLPKLVTGEKIGCYGLTEPDAGSDPGSMLTRAVDDGDSYILNGSKTWITNGTVADVAVVWAKLDGEVRGFLVVKGTKGFSAPEIKRKYSFRASVTSELVFDDVRIPKENILPKSKGLKSPLGCLSQARYGIAWGAIGAAQACYDEALNYTLERKQFGKPIASFQITQSKLVKILTEITKAQFMTLQLGRLKDKGACKHTHISLAKRNNVEMALEAARTVRNMLGAYGITADYQAMRHMCNLESVYTYEGTHDIHTLIVGDDITGIPAFR